MVPKYVCFRQRGGALKSLASTENQTRLFDACQALYALPRLARDDK